MLQIIPYEGHVRAAPIWFVRALRIGSFPVSYGLSGSPHPDGAFLVLCKNSSVSQMNYSISVPTNMSSADRQTADDGYDVTRVREASVAVEKYIVKG